MKRQQAKKAELLGDVDSKTVSRLIGASSDLALVLDGEGQVLDVIVQDAGLATLVGSAWKGRAWVDTVTVESREKVEGLLHEAAGGLPTRLRHVNHPFVGQDDLPISYAAVQFDAQPAPGRPGFIAFGRDLDVGPRAYLVRGGHPPCSSATSLLDDNSESSSSTIAS